MSERDETARRYARGTRRNAAILITGAGGEVGHGLIRRLHEQGRREISSIDIHELDRELKKMCMHAFTGDICDGALLGRLLATFEITEIYHLAALLSTRGEFTPETAHDVNVGGTLGLLRLAAEQARSHGRVVKFIFPSSIAAYGIPDLATKNAAGAVAEDEFLRPMTMYGCNKLSCENLGRYYAQHYRQLAKDRVPNILDFRCVRFPGLISADTLPSGGTSDYASEMVHAAALGKPYTCFVREDTRIPFATMPDAIQMLLALATADLARLTRCVYNLGGFSSSAGEFAEMVCEFFPDARISFEPDPQRQAIVDSWPADVDDSALRNDLNAVDKQELRNVFSDYIVPRIRARYER